MNPILEAYYPDKDVLARRQQAGLLRLEPAPESFIAYLHEEMRWCFLNGHDHASIVTACALIEFAVKDAVHFEDFIRDKRVFDKKKWDSIESLGFGAVIAQAKKRKIITKEQWKQLEWLRERIRNVYMHGQTPKWIKDKDVTFHKGDLVTGEVEKVTVSVADDIVVQRMIRIVADRNICDRVVRLVDGAVRYFCERGQALAQELDQRNPFQSTQDQLNRVLENMKSKGFDGDTIIMNEFPKE